MAVSIEAIVIQQLRSAANERRIAEDDRQALRDEHLDELTDKAEAQYEASNLQIDVNVKKAWSGAIGGAFGAFGTIGSNAANIVVDETDGRKVANLQREAGLIERNAAAIQHDLEEQQSTEEARDGEAQQTYRDGVEMLEKRAEVSRLA